MKTITTAMLPLLFLLITPELSAANIGGTFTTVNGSVDLLKPGIIRGIAVKEGDAVNINDTIRTKSNSSAVVTMPDQSVITIAPNSRVVITKALLGKDGRRKQSTIKLLKGKIKSLVTKSRESGLFGFFSSRSDFEVETPTSIIGVKGTDFSVLFGGGVATTFVDSGIILFTPNSGGGFFTSVIKLGANEIGIIGSDGKVIKTSDVPPGVMTVLNKGLVGTLTASADMEGLGITLEDADILEEYFESLPGDLIPITETNEELLNLFSAEFDALNFLGKGELTMKTTLTASFITETDLIFNMSGTYNLLTSLNTPVDFTANFTTLSPSNESIEGTIWGTFDGAGGLNNISVNGNEQNFNFYFDGLLNGTYTPDPALSNPSNEIGNFGAIGTGTFTDCSQNPASCIPM